MPSTRACIFNDLNLSGISTCIFPDFSMMYSQITGESKRVSSGLIFRAGILPNGFNSRKKTSGCQGWNSSTVIPFVCSQAKITALTLHPKGELGNE